MSTKRRQPIFGRGAATFPARSRTPRRSRRWFTIGLANEFGPHRICVNCLLPGSTDTPMMWRGVNPNEREAVDAEVAAAQPLRRFAQSDEIAPAAVFLVSSQPSF